MTALMTKSAYDDRRAALDKAIGLAEAEHASACFKEETGSGTADLTRWAKEHLDALVAEQQRLDTARKASQAEEGRLRAERKADDYKALVKSVDKALAAREAAVAAVVGATGKAVEAIQQYREQTKAIRTLATPFQSNARLAAPNVADSLNMTLENDVAERAFSAILATAHVRVAGSALLHEAFPNTTPENMEAKIADRVRAAIKGFAPAGGA